MLKVEEVKNFNVYTFIAKKGMNFFTVYQNEKYLNRMQVNVKISNKNTLEVLAGKFLDSL